MSFKKVILSLRGTSKSLKIKKPVFLKFDVCIHVDKCILPVNKAASVMFTSEAN